MAAGIAAVEMLRGVRDDPQPPAGGEDDVLVVTFGDAPTAEEAAETLLASKEGDKLHLVRETAELWFHTLVLLAWHGVGPEQVLAELQRREGVSGVAEKASRK